MSGRNRFWWVTVYPIKYSGSTPEAIEDAEANWLHETEKGPFHIGNNWVYLYGCMERGGKGKKLHCHYMAYFKNAIGLKAIQKIFGTFIKAKWVDDAETLETYVRKEGKFLEKKATQVAGPWEEGEKPTHTGQKEKMWQNIKNMIVDGSTNKAIYEKYPQACTFKKGITELRREFRKPDLDVINLEQFYPWQQELYGLVTSPPVKRQWIWVWSKDFNVGKTSMGTYLVKEHGALMGSFDSKSTMMNYMDHPIIVFDIPRTYRITSSDYAFLESLSDQRYIMSEKYESAPIAVKAHIVIFSNIEPPRNFIDRIKSINAIVNNIPDFIPADNYE